MHENAGRRKDPPPGDSRMIQSYSIMLSEPDNMHKGQDNYHQTWNLPSDLGSQTKKAQVIDSLELFELVAGAGFEPTTFGL